MGNVRTYSKKEAALYLTGMFGQNMIYNVVATGLYYYFQNVICLNAVALGWIFAIAKLIQNGANADRICCLLRLLFVL